MLRLRSYSYLDNNYDFLKCDWCINCCILLVVILDFVNHLYDYRLNWTLLSPVTIMITLLNRRE